MRRLVLTSSVALLGVACGAPAPDAPPPPTAATRRLAPPARCTPVPANAPLGSLLAAAQAGEHLCLADGVWVGAFVVPADVGLYGSARAVLRSSGVGTTVLLHDRASLRGVTIDGSGGRFDVMDAAVKINGTEIVVEGVTIEHSAFGILAEKSSRVVIRDNVVHGLGGPALGMRGDGIRLWETNDSLVEGNQVDGVRDCVVWYSSRNTVRNNRIADSRYGVHFMYSHFNTLEGNQFFNNEVGMFAMYSRNLTATGNEMLYSRGAAGIGIGVKESGNLVVRNNLLAHNTQGIFIDSSPINLGDRNVFEDNTIRLSDIGVGFLSSQKDNVFRHNVLRDNTAQVRVDGGGDAMQIEWIENEWGDYAGYDLDRDGLGDLPYELRDLSDALAAKHPDLQFLRGTPALALVSLAGEVVPLFAPKPILRDAHPRFYSPRTHAN